MKKYLLAALFACACSLTGCITIEYEEEQPVDNVVEGNGEVSPEAADVKEQIDVEIVPCVGSEWGGVGVLIKNGSPYTIGEMEVQVLFYDSEDNIIDTGSDGHDVVLPGSTVVSYMETPDEYARYDYKLNIDVEANGGYKNHAANIDIKTNAGENCVIIQFTNNAGVDIDEIEYAVVFYKGDKIVDVTNGIDVYDVPTGETIVEECSTWNVDYDRYEVYLNQAHTF